MILPLQIEFHNTRPVEDVETRVRQEFAELEKFYSQLVSCWVEVEVPEHERRGSVSKVRIDLGVPARHAMPQAEPARQEAEHVEVKAQRKDPSMAVHAAFNIARRRLEEFTGVHRSL